MPDYSLLGSNEKAAREAGWIFRSPFALLAAKIDGKTMLGEKIRLFTPLLISNLLRYDDRINHARFWEGEAPAEPNNGGRRFTPHGSAGASPSLILENDLVS